MMKKNFTFVLFLSLLFLAACETTIINRGYEMAAVNFDDIVIGKDNMQLVFDKYGSPTARSSVISDEGEYTWYYAYKKFAKTCFLKPGVVEQKIVAVTFGANDMVVSVNAIFGDKKIKMTEMQTESFGSGLSAKQIFSSAEKNIAGLKTG